MFAGNADVYGKADARPFNADSPSFGPNGSADTVLTFRNVHNWVSAGNAPAYFKAFFDVLKPGGVLGVVDHRAKPGTDLAPSNRHDAADDEKYKAIGESDRMTLRFVKPRG